MADRYSENIQSDVYCTIFKRISVAVALFDLDGLLLDANAAFLTVFGVSDVSALKGLTLFDRLSLSLEKQNCINSGLSAGYETVFDFDAAGDTLIDSSRNGKAYFSIKTDPILKESGFSGYIVTIEDITRKKSDQKTHPESEQLDKNAIQHHSAIATDISERRKMENALKEEQREFRRAQSLAHVGSWCFHLDTGTVSTSEETLKIYGIDHLKQITIKYVQSIPLPQYRQLLDTALQKLIQGGEPYDVEFQICRPSDNAIRHIHSVAEYDSTRKMVTGTIQDITEWKLAEKAIADERERLSVTLRSIGDGVITTDRQGRVVLINKVAETLTGWTQNEAQGKPLETIFNIIHEFTRQPCEDPVKKVLSTGQIIELANHTMLIARNGTERVIEDSGAPIKDKNNEIIGVVLVFRDMTEKQKLLETIQRTAKLDSIGVLAGGIAHDFNNLVSGIFGYVDMACEYTNEEKVLRCLSKVSNSIDRAKGLTQQLLTFAKGGVPVKKVSALFPFIQESAQFALSGSNALCKVDVPDDLWMCDYDSNQIGQVVDNLIINAKQAMPDGGLVEISAENIIIHASKHSILTPGKYVKLAFKDQGVGMPKEMLNRIFDPFYTTKSSGHGLGLATCYSIISKHGGHIEVESQPGKGSTFLVYLPASEQASSTLPQRASTKHVGTGTILVMDDENVVLGITCEMLRSFGYSVISAVNGREALEKFTAERNSGRGFTALIFDLTIPGELGGKETIKEIRKLDETVPVFVSSGYADDPIMADPNAYGFTASISKPFRKADMAELLETFLQSKKREA